MSYENDLNSKHRFVELFNARPGIDQALTNHPLISMLFRWINSDPGSFAIFNCGHNQGVTTTLRAFIKHWRSLDMWVVTRSPRHWLDLNFQAVTWRRPQWLQNQIPRPLLIIDDPLSIEEIRSLELRHDFSCFLRSVTSNYKVFFVNQTDLDFYSELFPKPAPKLPE